MALGHVQSIESMALSHLGGLHWKSTQSVEGCEGKGRLCHTVHQKS